GATDPNPAHTGRARPILEAAGIEVTEGVLTARCEALNEPWNIWIATGLPMVTAKAAMSLDGRISPSPGTRWITSPEARADAMRLRAAHQAVLVGGGTVRADNPRLTVRGLGRVRQPVPAVWTRSGRLPASSHLLRGGRARGFAGCSLREALRRLASEGIQSVLIEGGGRTLGEAFDRGLVHRVVIYIAPVCLGGPVPAVGGRGCASAETGWIIESPRWERAGDGLKCSGRVVRAAHCGC
ncbi:MAG: dihydrofolate reductase family protein, partial [Terrimicrobiaceae bacterium]|nr:dihydrofolate reductase family protein [Terrimicrobiaceae bacterium]